MKPDYVEEPRKKATDDLHSELLLKNTFNFTMFGVVAFVAASFHVLFQ